MILRAVIISWLAFQAIQLTIWKRSFVLWSRVTEPAESRIDQVGMHDLFLESIFEDKCNNTNASSLTACENCGCSTQTLRMVLPKSVDCEITDDILREIWELINAAYEKITVPPEPARRGVLADDEDDQDLCQNLTNHCNAQPPVRFYDFGSTRRDPVCDKMIEDIKETMNLIAYEIEALLEFLVDPEKLRIKIAQLESCVNCLRNNLADIIENAANETAQCYENGLGQVFTCFATELDKRTNRIHELEERVSSKIYDLIAANVLAGRYHLASYDYIAQNNESIFDRLLTELYESKKIEQILEFGLSVHRSNITGRILVYTTLNNLMNCSTCLDVPPWHWIVLRSFITWDREDFCKSPNLCYELGLPFEYAPLMVNVATKANTVLSSWATQIRQDNFDSIIIEGSPEFLTMTGRAFHDAIDELVKHAYDSNPANLKSVINFVSALRWNNQSYVGFSALIREASGVGVDDQLQIALAMKTKMKNLKGPDLEVDGSICIKFKDLATTLKASVQAVIWGKVCKLQASEVDRNYLYVESNGGFSGGNRKVTRRNEVSKFTEWSLERIERSPNTFEFRLQSQQFEGEYLGTHVPYRHQDFAHAGFEYVCTSPPAQLEPDRKYYSWEMRFKDVKQDDQVELFHLGRQAYLYADTSNNVYLNMFGHTSGNTRWKIDCTMDTIDC